MRCTYCMPSDGFASVAHKDILTYEEILRIVKISSGIGVKKFRITGGEPLVRKGIVDLVREMNAIDGVETTFTTNGLLLEEMAQSLKEAGVKRLNISIDSLKPARFEKITVTGHLDKVMRGIEKAYQVGFSPIKLNVVAIRGFNDDEIMDFIALAKDRPYQVRFIEFMPIQKNSWNKSQFMACDEIEAAIRKNLNSPLRAVHEKNSPSRDYAIDGYAGRIGLISPVSRHFCDSCNRIRLTSDGHIKSCLLREGEEDIKSAMRRGASDEEIKALISRAVILKGAGHQLGDKKGGMEEEMLRPMTQIGG